MLHASKNFLFCEFFKYYFYLLTAATWIYTLQNVIATAWASNQNDFFSDQKKLLINTVFPIEFTSNSCKELQPSN